MFCKNLKKQKYLVFKRFLLNLFQTYGINLINYNCLRHISNPYSLQLRFSGFFADISNELNNNQNNSTNVNSDSELKNIAENIVTGYLKEKLLDSEQNPLLYWNLKEKETPTLAKVL